MMEPVVSVLSIKWSILAFAIGVLLAASPGCHAAVSIPQAVTLRAEVLLEAELSSPVVASEGGAQVEVGVVPPDPGLALELGLAAPVLSPPPAVEASAEVPTLVPLDGSVTVEFFGIPLQQANDVVFVLDCSGSMANRARGPIANITPHAFVPSKMQVAREELAAALERLPEGAAMNVVFFNESVGAFAAGLVPLQESARKDLIDYVRRSAPTGRTALAPAMRTALTMGARRVVLLSDGLGNVGGDSEAVLRDAREAMLGGVRIDTIGLGADADSELMRNLAGESGGLYQAL